MAHQANPFALLLDDDEGDDVSILLSKIEPKIPVLPPASSDQTKQKNGSNGFSSNESVRGRGRGGRGRGVGRIDGIDQIEHLHDRGYSGRGGMGRGRGRSFDGIGNRNRMEYGEVGSEFREKSNYLDGRQTRFDARRFGEENQGPNGEERENVGYRGYDQSRRLRGHGSDLEKREFRDEGYEKSYGGDGENRGFRGGEGRGRGYGGRGWRGGRDGGRGGGRYESNDGLNASESKKGSSADEKEPIVDNINDGDGVSGRYDIFFTI